MSKFEVGEKIRIRDYNDIPAEYRNSGTAKMQGAIGTVEDVFYSKANKCDFYRINFEDYPTSIKLYREDLLEAVDDGVKYEYEFTYLDNAIVVRLFEVTENGRLEIAKGHGHIIHDGVLGIAQASSYAVRKIQSNLEDREKNK